MKNGSVVQNFPNTGTRPAQTLTTPLILVCNGFLNDIVSVKLYSNAFFNYPSRNIFFRPVGDGERSG